MPERQKEMIYLPIKEYKTVHCVSLWSTLSTAAAAMLRGSNGLQLGRITRDWEKKMGHTAASGRGNMTAESTVTLGQVCRSVA